MFNEQMNLLAKYVEKNSFMVRKWSIRAAWLILSGILLLLMYLYIPLDRVMSNTFNSMLETNQISGISSEASFILSSSLKLLLLLAFILSLSIFFNLFIQDKSYLQKGFAGFILYFLFYIPCLFSDYLTYSLQEFNSTPLVVFVLIVLEVIVLILFFYLPKLISILTGLGDETVIV